MTGSSHNVNSSEHLLADNSAIHGQVLELFGEVFRGQFRVPIPRIG
jgi:myo-inositol-1(or 4)-monophosphatase